MKEHFQNVFMNKYYPDAQTRQKPIKIKAYVNI